MTVAMRKTAPSPSSHLAVIRSFIVDTMLLGKDQGLQDEDSLYEMGVFDSTAVMELGAFLEQQFRIAVDDEDLTESNLGSIAKVAAFIEKKLSVAELPLNQVRRNG